MGNRLVQFSYRLESDRQAMVGPGIGALGAKRLTQVGCRLLRLALLYEGVAKTEVSIGIAWPLMHCLAVTCHRLIQFALGLQGDSQVQAGLDKIRTKEDGLPEIRHCLIKVSELPKRVAEVAVRGGEVRLEADRLPKTLDGLDKSRLKNERSPKIVVGR